MRGAGPATDAGRRLVTALADSRRDDDPTALALASLRPEDRGGGDGAGWPVGIDGELGRGLLQSAGSWYVVPMLAAGQIRLRARVKLLAHDWRDGRGMVAATVWARGADGRWVRQWQRILASDRAHGRPAGVRLACELPQSTVALAFAVQRIGRARPRYVGRALWSEPVLHGALSPAPAAPAAAPPSAEFGAAGPSISVLMPVHDPPPTMLREALESVRGQSYDRWELCITDDGSRDPEVRAVLDAAAAADSRVRVHRHDRAQGISGATNAALALAGGDYIALLDHDDLLAPAALATVAARLAAEPALDMVYSDEDIISVDGERLQWHQKPGWSPEQFETAMYTCHLGVYRRALVDEVGGMDSRFDGCQDYDLVLRLIERGARVAHIPQVLYHWRAHAASTAGGEEAKPYAYLAQPGTISDYLQRLGTDAEVQFAKHPGMHRIIHRSQSSATVTFALAATDERGITQAARTLVSQSLAQPRVIVASPAQHHAAIVDALHAGGLAPSRVTVVTADPVADRAGALAAAARRADGDRIVLAPHPLHGLTHDWLERLVGYAARTEIGAAGPIVLSPAGAIAHAGIAMPNGIPLWIHHGLRPDVAPAIVTNVIALSGLIVTDRGAYERLGGIDAALGELALIDYCLRLAAIGRRSVLVPDVRVSLTAPERPDNDLRLFARLRERWAEGVARDPYYSPWYRTDRADLSRMAAPA